VVMNVAGWKPVIQENKPPMRAATASCFFRETAFDLQLPDPKDMAKLTGAK
jgi:hypothetical protein